MTTRLIKGFNNALLTTFDVMRISKRQKLVGSASVLGNIITNDYDLNEMFEEKSKNDMDILTKLYLMFLWKFKTIFDSKDLWIIDFKCGEYNGEPIRWTMEDMNNGYKNIGSNRLFFTNCLTQINTITKLDVVQLINNRFVEISEIYYIKVNGLSNYSISDFTLGHIGNTLYDDMEDLIMTKNYFKALKRQYRLLVLFDRKPKTQSKLTELFNGQYGQLYYVISQLKTLILMNEQMFRSVSNETLLQVQQNIKDDLGKVLNYEYAIINLNHVSTIRNLNTIINFLNNYLNTKVKKYINIIL